MVKAPIKVPVLRDWITRYTAPLPFLIKEASDRPVKGELYEVSDSVLAELDKLEAHPLVFKREIIDITDMFGNKQAVWAYLHSVNFKGKLQATKEYEFV